MKRTFRRRAMKMGLNTGALGPKVQALDPEIQGWLLGKMARGSETAADVACSLIKQAYQQETGK